MGEQHLDEMLDTLAGDRTGRIAEPPPAFLRAVGRRRRQRRLARASVVVMVAAALALMYAGRPAAPRLGQTRMAASSSANQPTAISLTRLNSRLDAEHLILPAADSEGRPEVVNLGLRSGPADVERWFQQ